MTAACHQTPQASRISEKLQKANEGHEGQIKGQTLSKIKILYFFQFSRVLWSCLTENFLQFKFQGHKGQKGCYTWSKLKIKKALLYGSKFGLPTSLVININALNAIQHGITMNNNFRAQNVSQRSDIFIESKNWKNTK